jgi:uncharacterized protein YjbJ (UPF0337 family)
MNKDIFQGDLNFLKGKIKEQWGKLTDDDLVEIRGKREQLVGRLQKRYGLAKEKAEEQIAAWEKQLLAKVGSVNEAASRSSSAHDSHGSSNRDRGSSSHRR